MPLPLEYYRGKSVLVTGHTGFKGSWLALWLTELGARVHGYALAPPTSPSLFAELGIESRLASHRLADVRDHATLAEALRSAQPELVFHLAAQPLVRRSYREPRETFETNVMGTVNLLDAVRQVDSVRVCQIITTDKCYENREWVYAYRENDPMGGADPYSGSKGCAELAVAAYRHSYFHPESFAKHGVCLASVRAGNVIGGGDWAEDRIIPDCVRALERQEPVLVRSPGAVRPWQHVLEPLSGYLQLAIRQAQTPDVYADAYNFGPSVSGNVTVREVVEAAIESWGTGTWTSPQVEAGQAAAAKVHEANFLKLDITKAVTMLGWQPKYSVKQAIGETIRWYRHRNLEGQNFGAAEFCLAQIRKYVETACHN